MMLGQSRSNLNSQNNYWESQMFWPVPQSEVVFRACVWNLRFFVVRRMQEVSRWTARICRNITASPSALGRPSKTTNLCIYYFVCLHAIVRCVYISNFCLLHNVYDLMMMITSYLVQVLYFENALCERNFPVFC